jgi:hypothetical protein
METPTKKILMIIERLGMSGVKAAAIMQISENKFRKNKMESASSNNFTENNFTDLLDFLIDEVKFLITFDLTENLNNYDRIIDKIDHIYKNNPKNREKDDWNLFDELKAIVDLMEKKDAFSDMKVYQKIINHIEMKSEQLTSEPNIFTHERYYNYVRSDKINSHNRWFDYLIYKRQQTILQILGD